VTVPIKAFPATNDRSDVSFRQFHRSCHTPIQMRRWCPHHETFVEKDEIVKGYEAEKGKYVFVDDKEIASLRPKSTHAVALSHRIDARAIDPIYIERTYYLAPANEEAGEPFAVIRDGLGEDAAVGRLAQWGREYLVAVVRSEAGLALHTLRTAGEVRGMDGIAELEFAETRAKAPEVRLARQILSNLERVDDLSRFVDDYQVALRKLLKTKGAPESVAPEESGTPKVVNLMDALRRSLDQVGAGGHRRAGSRTRKHARVVRHPATARKRAS
jgi:DNA end-binding protein Ku